MSWNYRFCCETVPDGLGDTEDVWTVREVYYDDEGKVNGFSADPTWPQGSTWIELADDLGRMNSAMGQVCYRIDGDTIEEMPRGERFRSPKARARKWGFGPDKRRRSSEG